MSNLSCQICGKKLQSRKNKKYCSRVCYYKAIKQKSYKCLNCGKEVKRKPSKVKRANYNIFCSHECHSSSRKGKVYKSRKGRNLICKTCGKSYYVAPFLLEISKYCSRKCSRVGSRRSIRKQCPTCGKEFNSRFSQPRIHCSRICFLKTSGKVLSSLEEKVQSILPVNINFVGNHNYWICFQDGKRKKPDFILTKKNGSLPKKVTKVIEVHGDYWHQDEWNNRGQDLIDKYKQVGIDCLVLWGSEIERDFGQVMKKVSDFLNVEIRQLRLF